MRIHPRVSLMCVALALSLTVTLWADDEKVAAPTTAASAPANDARKDDATAITKASEAYIKAVNDRDLAAIAACWTEEGEHIGETGDTLRGPAAIEAAYKEFFERYATSNLEAKVEKLRFLGKDTAIETGTFHLKHSETTTISEFSVLFVREDGNWKIAIVRERASDKPPVTDIKELAWLVGDWTGTMADGELHCSYSWAEGENFLHNRFTLKRDGQPALVGLQIMGVDHLHGGFRTWMFDVSGGTSEGHWAKDADRWVVETRSIHADGVEGFAKSLFIPQTKDEYTWQPLERSRGGEGKTAGAPIKVVRAKAVTAKGEKNSAESTSK